MKTVANSNYIMSKEIPPCETASQGEVIVFCSEDAYAGNIKSEADLLGDLPMDESNPTAGPVFIEGAHAGDTLAVKIEKIEMESPGIICTSAGWGSLCEHMEERTAFIPLEGDYGIFKGIRIPLNPMVGTIGTAPEEPIASGYPGRHGGNFDSTVIRPGCTLYLPVFAEGALLQAGDLHAIMGDGELCGAGVEVAGKTHLTATVLPGFKLNWPVSKDENGWYVHGCGANYEAALKNACLELQRLIVNAWGWDETDAYFYIGMQGSAAANQTCTNPIPEYEMAVRVHVPLREDMPPLVG